MSLKSKIMPAMKEAMKAKDKVALETLRAIKAELMLAETATGSVGEMSTADEIKLLMKMMKQRKDAAAIYIEQGRSDLAEDELVQTKILDIFLPQQLSLEALEKEVAQIIERVGATGPADMGKVMGITSKELAGKAEGRAIATMVKTLLNK
jgi:uncharacterized protein